MISPIRLRDHVPAETLEMLSAETVELIMAAEWTLDVAVVLGRGPTGAHANCTLTPNSAALELQRRASKLSAGIAE